MLEVEVAVVVIPVQDLAPVVVAPAKHLTFVQW
jgi:hypothetical protein